MKKHIIAIASLALTSSFAFAQDSTRAAAALSMAPPKLRPITIGVEAGTTGPGALVSWRFADHFAARAGIDYFEYSQSATIQGINYHANMRLLSEPLTLDYYPWTNHSFHLSFGVLFNENQLTGNAMGNVTINGNSYITTANLEIKQQVVDPYFSIGGNLYFDREHHWSLGGELGVFWTGDPRVSLTAPGASSTPQGAQDVRAEQAQVKHYAKDAEFWPVAKLSLNYSF